MHMSVTIALLHQLFALSVVRFFSGLNGKRSHRIGEWGKPKWHGVSEPAVTVSLLFLVSGRMRTA
jgi:hypothetical protein